MLTRGKIVFVGDPGVGKTAIIRRYQLKEYSCTASTIGANQIRCTVELKDSKTIALNVWDTAGQDDYRYLLPMFIRGAEVAVVCFDLAAHRTFDHLPEWISVFHREAPSCQILICGNKTDLEYEVGPPEIEAFTSSVGFPFFRTSAKIGEGVETLFSAVAEIVQENEDKRVAPEAPRVFIEEKPQNQTCCGFA
jgi:Ras-related protein Rab-6A